MRSGSRRGQRHPDAVFGPLNWELPGGAAERDESPTQIAVREVLEETGLRVSAERLTGVYYERQAPARSGSGNLERCWRDYASGMSSVGSLGKHADFLKLWGGQTISLLGSEVTLLAFPLTAILVLEATPLQLGILSAAQSAPFLLLSLPAGVWVDRLPRRPVLIVADVGRALLLGSVPIAAAANVLSMELLYAVALCTGSLTAIFDVAYWVPIYSVTALSIRQGITPDRLQGRVNATNRFLQWGTLPIGSLIGGALGGAIGLRPTIGVAVLGTVVAVIWFALSPVRQLREPPAEIQEPAFASG